VPKLKEVYKKVSKESSSVPKQKTTAKKVLHNSLECPTPAPQKERAKKVSKKSLKCAQTKIKVKKSYKAVPQMCPNKKKKCQEKKVQIPFHPLLSGLVPGFRIFTPSYGDFMESKNRG
jgi:hypothetical protein